MRVVCRSALYSAWGRAIVRLRGLPGGDFALETQANEGAVSHRLTGPVASTRKRGLKLIAGNVYAPMGPALRLAQRVRLISRADLLQLVFEGQARAEQLDAGDQQYNVASW
jgi:hypothetical protein